MNWEAAGGRAGGGGPAALGMADWLGLAAAPTFSLMAALSSLGPPDPLCVSGRGPWPLGGMPPMYLLMTAFHLVPWIRLIAARQVRRMKSATRAATVSGASSRQ